MHVTLTHIFTSFYIRETIIGLILRNIPKIKRLLVKDSSQFFVLNDVIQALQEQDKSSDVK